MRLGLVPSSRAQRGRRLCTPDRGSVGSTIAIAGARPRRPTRATDCQFLQPDDLGDPRSDLGQSFAGHVITCLEPVIPSRRLILIRDVGSDCGDQQGAFPRIRRPRTEFSARTCQVAARRPVRHLLCGDAFAAKRIVAVVGPRPAVACPWVTGAALGSRISPRARRSTSPRVTPFSLLSVRSTRTSLRMPIRSLGPDGATLKVLTFREGPLGDGARSAAARDRVRDRRRRRGSVGLRRRRRALASRGPALRDGRPLPGVLRPADIGEIEATIVGTVLRARRFPDVRFASSEVTTRDDGLVVRGTLTLAGASPRARGATEGRAAHHERPHPPAGLRDRAVPRDARRPSRDAGRDRPRVAPRRRPLAAVARARPRRRTYAYRSVRGLAAVHGP